MLIGSSGGVGCCVILERAVLSRVLKADVSDMSVCVEMEGLGWGGAGRVACLGYFRVRCRVVEEHVS